ncbi:hypothetical protein WALSEDRAFT_59006 [Wallemia mellicola CBS 633.66]|uniref:Uncharacterized protein n=1 Tax=Wallemia mellicola (strain ATCC MYA-4683 / CBS 633.66) TaxID=671144 RepID=I4YIX4_WALMC|nr:hypothetical protein WALSEDRAFT_59006 [Wallemia mellicola CBS 633.66]EIM23916.1 hypothetical protein WALSEDRAFT_59006 [Wallemia mellicola CBS 633.66]|eukprot:XP_006955757.1 hypothetical protein WALSEDRAFT_59006 [Wallemia mellicola CBS 633.66]
MPVMNMKMTVPLNLKMGSCIQGKEESLTLVYLECFTGNIYGTKYPLLLSHYLYLVTIFLWELAIMGVVGAFPIQLSSGRKGYAILVIGNTTGPQPIESIHHPLKIKSSLCMIMKRSMICGLVSRTYPNPTEKTAFLIHV